MSIHFVQIIYLFVLDIEQVVWYHWFKGGGKVIDVDVKKIKHIMVDKEMNLEDMANILEVKKEVVGKKLSGNRRFTFKDARLICRKMEIEFTDVLSDEALKDLRVLLGGIENV